MENQCSYNSIAESLLICQVGYGKPQAFDLSNDLLYKELSRVIGEVPLKAYNIQLAQEFVLLPAKKICCGQVSFPPMLLKT